MVQSLSRPARGVADRPGPRADAPLLAVLVEALPLLRTGLTAGAHAS